MRNNRLTFALLFGLAARAVVLAPAGAQTPDSTQFRCEGKVISSIEIQPHPPAVTERGPNVLRQALQRFVFQSGTTRDRAIRPFLLARVGDRCSDRWLPELARVVRAQPYLAVATVRAQSDGAGGVRLVVETVDEIPVIVGGGYTKNGLTNVKYGNSNIDGTGFYAAGQWRDGRAYRDALALTLRQYGLFGQPLVAEVNTQRDVLGGQFNASVSRPFLSDLEHIAWYAGGTHDDSYRGFARASGPALSLPVVRDVWSVGGVARFGWRGASVMVGPVATYENARPNDLGVIASDSGLVPADTAVFAHRYTPYKTFRAGLGAGFRWLDYIRVTGFDALIGEQDVARGFRIASTFERGLGAFSATDQTSLVSVNMYSGVGTPQSFIGLAMQGEELPGGGGDSWSAAALSGRLAWYLKHSETRTFEASAEFAGGWRERLPLQLSLGDVVSGVRGYNGVPIAGGRRAVLRLEERRVSYQTKFIQWGTAFFTDIGKTWSGDVPFGQTTVAKASVGIGLLAAVPPKSRRMVRADLAVPVTGGTPKGWVLRVFATDLTRFFWRDPSDLSPVRAGAPASSIFGWP